MRKASLLAWVAVALPILVGCGASTDSGEVSPSEGVFDPAAPLEPQMGVAIDADDAALVATILDAGFDPTSHFDHDLNALHRAAVSSASDLVPVFVSSGVPLEERVNRQTPLMMAVAFGDAETVTAFLDAGADQSVVDSGLFDALPIHVAARWGNVEALSALLAWGIDIDEKQGGNSTALIYAAYFGQLDAVNYLVSQGADINWRDDYGDTPLVAASRMGYNEVAAVLRDLGASE
jgi:cytohesin